MTDDKKTTEIIKKELTYTQKVWHAVAIIALLVGVILIARVALTYC